MHTLRDGAIRTPSTRPRGRLRGYLLRSRSASRAGDGRGTRPRGPGQQILAVDRPAPHVPGTCLSKRCHVPQDLERVISKSRYMPIATHSIPRTGRLARIRLWARSGVWRSAARFHLYGGPLPVADGGASAFQPLLRGDRGGSAGSPGQVALDVGCGTGLCCGLPRERVGAQGGVVGIEESPEMAAVAREHSAEEGWHNVTVCTHWPRRPRSRSPQMPLRCPAIVSPSGSPDPYDPRRRAQQPAPPVIPGVSRTVMARSPPG